MPADKPIPPSSDFEPIDPDYKATKNYRQLAAEHPEWGRGIQQLAEMEAMLEAQGTADLVTPDWWDVRH